MDATFSPRRARRGLPAPAAPPSAAAVLALALGLLAGCGGSDAGREAPARPAAPPSAAARREAPQAVSAGGAGAALPAGTERQGFLGVLLAREAIDLAAEAPGRLTAVHVRAGDPVARGTLIASLDTQTLRQDLEVGRAVMRQIQIEEEKSRIALADAEGRLARRQSFPEAFPKEEILATENQRDAARAAVEGARARVSEQRVRVAQMESALARAELRAPFPGTVAVRYLDAGATVGQGTPIVRLVSARDLMVRFAVPERQVGRVALGQPVAVAVRGSGAALAGVVEKIAPEVDPASGMVLAEARIEAAGAAAGGIQPGAIVRVLPRAPS